MPPACWGATYRLYLLLEQMKATFTLSRDHAKTGSLYQGVSIHLYIIGDNFYLDFLIDIALENGGKFVVQAAVEGFSSCP